MAAHIVLGSLAFLSLGLLFWQWILGRRLALHHRSDDVSFRPSVSVLKPVKGVDTEMRGCLESWLRQDYPADLEILFGVERDDLNAIALIESLGDPRARLIVIDGLSGVNAKAAKLEALAAEAMNEVVCVSDADTFVPADFLLQFIQPLRNGQVGMVNCFYLLANMRNGAMWWEAIGINADFWGQVLQSNSLKPMDFALGAVIGMRREVLDEIGGFGAVVNHLADDFQLGRRVAEQGRRIELVPLVAECREAEFGWRQAWTHQLRWARTIRVCRPGGYFASILNNTTLWLLLWLAAPVPPMGCIVAAGLLLRVLVAANLMRHLTGNDRHVPWLWLVWVKDLLGALLWLGAFLGNTVSWRGDRFRILPGGKLELLASATVADRAIG
jgi:ceramide glucosyltransferase